MTRVPGEDRGWLGFDREQASSASDQADPAAPQGHGGQDAASPWLRHDLGAGEPAAMSVPGEGSGSGEDAGTSRRDPAWLDPELEVPGDPDGVHRDEQQDQDQYPDQDERRGHGHDGTAPRRTDGSVDQTQVLYGDERHDTGVLPTLAAGPVDGDATRPRGSADEGAEGAEDGSPDAGPLAVVGAAVKEFAIVVGMALVLSFVVKTWLLQAFYIPSGSMEDTLVLNDRVIVSKLTPGPIDLKRGDIIVFADPGDWLEETPPVPHGKVVTAIRETMTFVGLLPDNSENHLIKRVIGLPGDHVVCCDEGGRITINGVAIKEPYLKPGDAASEQDFDITVPRGRVWVMGDHRSNSADSRAHDGPAGHGSQGSVDERLIVGRAVALVWPLDHLTWLSNPHDVFAKVPAPSSQGPAVGQPNPDGGSTTGSGGAEVQGNDGDTSETPAATATDGGG
jgi:signal peptidase I